ncbi:hypothetical protein [Photobacterium leiognathi]|uniref:hypothetical protein n=1 Tax=Photobacterium leiognathi TaxID=553611 RepID=UPI0029820B3E|nr:hypothetical protein [Photobacterium leiognathi]
MLNAVVYKGHTLGVLNADNTAMDVLGGLKSIGGITSSDKPISINNQDDIRTASKHDFDLFRVKFESDLYSVSNDVDIDGFVMCEGIEERTEACKGFCLEVVVSRPQGDNINRFFHAKDSALFANIYQQAISNPNVIFMEVV